MVAFQSFHKDNYTYFARISIIMDHVTVALQQARIAAIVNLTQQAVATFAILESEEQDKVLACARWERKNLALNLGNELNALNALVGNDPHT
jgi:hypothetical protein